jgi:hypothetical protein
MRSHLTTISNPVRDVAIKEAAHLTFDVTIREYCCSNEETESADRKAGLCYLKRYLIFGYMRHS